ncbi:MAG: hypothetical protein MJZ37_02190 [Bacilli bacterium]|nr:hypothetical protein [Bacilli bacterium]
MIRFVDCLLHLVIAISLVFFITLEIIFSTFISGKKRKDKNGKETGFSNANIATICNVSTHFVLWLVFVISDHCWFCIILQILYVLTLILIIILVIFRNRVLGGLIKSLNKTKRTTKTKKLITKLTNLKNKLDYNDSAISLSDAIRSASVLKIKSAFDLEGIKENFLNNKNCELKIDENFNNTKYVSESYSLKATVISNKGKLLKDRFAIIYDLNKPEGRAIVLFLKINPKDRFEVLKKYPFSIVSKFPIGNDYIYFSVNDEINYEELENLFNKAYTWAVECLEKKEFNKMSKKIKM